MLLLPVLVALILGGLRVRAELAEASKLSSVRDQLSVLRTVVELAGLVDAELVAAVAPTDSATTRERASAVDVKALDLQRDVAVADLGQQAERDLNTALGWLGGLRTNDGGSDRLDMIEAYRATAFGLSETPSGIIAVAGSSDLDGIAGTVRAVMQLRSSLAVTEALLRRAGTDPVEGPALALASRAAAEQEVISGQIDRGLPENELRQFAEVAGFSGSRQDILHNALVANRLTEPGALLPDLGDELATLNTLLANRIDELSTKVGEWTNQARSEALRDTALVIAALLGAFAVALLVARSLIGPVRRLHAAALDVAHRQLPETIGLVRSGGKVPDPRSARVDVDEDEEIGQLARAFDDMHRQAVRLAGEQAELRTQVSEMFTTLSRRSQSLVELQLSVIEELEAEERDPQRLAELFRLDHLATRLRRNGENLQVLAGGSPARRNTGPVSSAELLRGATSEVKDYRRVMLVNAPNGSVRSQAAADIVHVLAELLENAIRFSPPQERVVLTADRGAENGLLIEVVDNGLGMAPEDLAAANGRLAAGDAVSPETTRRMGLFVVGRLAALHGVTVRLRSTNARKDRPGVTASVHVPGDLIIADGTVRQGAPRPVNGVAVRGVVGDRNQLSGTSTAMRLGRVRPVARPGRTPIFDGVVSNWFADAPGERVAEPSEAARPSAELPQSAVTAAGLPTRKPGAQLSPGAALPRRRTPAQPASFRDPAAVRSNLARHYQGMQAARRQAAEEPAPNREGKADP
ncbi:histidine kinase [Prauserella marina]|nr:histidine kinase [Prauserella marina]